MEVMNYVTAELHLGGAKIGYLVAPPNSRSAGPADLLICRENENNFVIVNHIITLTQY